MKVLSILQPWATLAVMGYKKIETRSWNTKYRGPLLIHASKKKIKVQEGMYELFSELGDIPGFMDNYKDLPYGEIIGKVNLATTCQTDKFIMLPETSLLHHEKGSWQLTNQEIAFGDYTDGRYGWFLSDPVEFKDHHYPVKGSLGLWNFEPEICLRCGCTGEDACVSREFGPCWWVDENLCSHCEEGVASTQIKESVKKMFTEFKRPE